MTELELAGETRISYQQTHQFAAGRYREESVV